MDDNNHIPHEPIIFDAEEELERRRNDRTRKNSARTVTLCLLSLAGALVLAGGASYYIGDRSLFPEEFVAAVEQKSEPSLVEISAPAPAATPSPAPSPTPVAAEAEYTRTRIRINGASYAVLASREAAEELLSEVEYFYESLIQETGELVSSPLETVELEAVLPGDSDYDVELDSVEELLKKFTSPTTPLTVVTKLCYTYVSPVEPKTVKEEDKYLLIGTRVVESLGRAGRVRTTVTGEYHNGVLQDKTSSRDEILIEAEPYRVRVGTLKASSVKEPGRSEGKKGKTAEGLSFKKPVAASVSSNFGQRRGEAHLGLDYETASGSSVKAACAGTVVCVMERGGYGLLIEIDHTQGFVTRYAHLSEAKVKIGDKVEQGQEIGLSGASGNAEGTKPVLHFELLIDGEAYNPRYYIG